MDTIIELIIVFYLISIFLRFLKKSQEKKDTPPPSQRPRQAPPLPPRRDEREPQPSSQKGPQAPPPRPVIYVPRDQDALDVLAEWERKAKARKEGTAEPQSSQGGVSEIPQATMPKTAKGEIPEVTARKSEVPPPRPPLERQAERPRSQEVSRQETAASGQPAAVPAMMMEHVTPSAPAEPFIFPEAEGEEEEMPFFTDPTILWQGIVMAEILRPSLARRNLFLLPYQR